MQRFAALAGGAIVRLAIASAQPSGPYKILKPAKVGGEGGWDYIYADVAGRRLYIPRRGPRAAAAPTRDRRRQPSDAADHLQPRHARAGRRDRRRRRQRRRRRSEIRPRLHQQQAGLDVRHEDA